MEESDEEDEIKKRRKLERISSISEPNLVTAYKNQHTGFPPGTTVDELFLYRRKKPVNFSSHDNLRIESGSFKLIKSEYTKKYRKYNENSDNYLLSSLLKPKSSLKLDGLQEFLSEYHESFREYPIERLTRVDRQRNELDSMELVSPVREITYPLTEASQQFIKHANVVRQPLQKRLTNLKIDGDYYHSTENTEQFIEYLLEGRTNLQRRKTNLKLEGDMETKTETRDKYVPYELEKRPPLCKKFTNLHLEGDMNIMTEKQEQFKPYDVEKRHVYTKKSTSLHLQGDLSLMPEYRSEFVDYKSLERTKPALPVNNLKPDGFYGSNPDLVSPYSTKAHPIIPNLREPITTPTSSRPPSVLRNDHHLTPSKNISRSHQNLFLSGNLVEASNAYTDFEKTSSTPRTSRRVFQQQLERTSPERTPRRKLQEEIGRSVDKTSKSRLQSPKRDLVPDYYQSYIDFPRERSRNHRPESCTPAEGEIEILNEQFIPISNSRRGSAGKFESELKYDDKFQCQPEYRKAYVDYLIRERIDRKTRTIDNLKSKPAERVFDFISPQDSSNQNGILSNGNIQKVTAKPPSSSSTSSTLPKTAKSKIPSGNLSQFRSYSQIEEAAFGPKLQVPPRKSSSSSRSSSPLPPASRRRSTRSSRLHVNEPTSTSSFDSDVPKSKYTRFGRTVKVENLASKSVGPSIQLPGPAGKSKWMREDSTQSDSSAFYVIESDVDQNKNRRRRRSIYLDDDERWVPSWH